MLILLFKLFSVKNLIFYLLGSRAQVTTTPTTTAPTTDSTQGSSYELKNNLTRIFSKTKNMTL